MYCTKCGAMLDDSAVICPRCGCATQNYRPGYNPRQPVRTCSPKSRLAAILLCVFLGGLGIHRFYVGKIGTGILYTLTLGIFGIGTLVDLIKIVLGKFTDKNGNYIQRSK